MMTITEALAELKTIEKRITAKREFVRNYMFRLDNLKDPFEKDGGSVKHVHAEMQAIADLEARAVTVRRAIQSANDSTVLSLSGTEMSIADWLVWRREVAPSRERFLRDIAQKLNTARDTVRRQQTYTVGSVEQPKVDIIVNVDESRLNKELESLQEALGNLDGQLSLKNATVMVEV